jgi:hypothetical protein
VHLEGLEEKMRLMTHALLQTLKFCPVEVVLQDGGVVGVRALLDNNTGTFARGETADISQSLVSLI